MGDWADRQMAQFRERETFELDALGVDITDNVREGINIPVEYVDGGIIRSDPGEKPRREFGHLWESQGHEVTESPSGRMLTCTNNASYGGRLEFGDGNLEARPFFYDTIRGWLSTVKSRLMDAVLGKR